MSIGRLLRCVAATAVLAAVAVQIGDLGPGPLGISAQAAPSGVSFSVFFTSLQPHGIWVRNANYNYVWVPTSVDRNWSPYTHGHWVYTDRYGWYFQSDEPFARIVYHYGRWGYDPNIGWFWVPGTRWAPAWVAWRRDDRNVGWAPLPPEGRGYAVNINITINIGDVPQPYWRFVRADQFLDPDLHTVVVAGDHDPDLFRRSQPAGSVVVQNNVIVNNVINLTFIEQATKKKVEVQTVNETSDPKQLQTQGKPGAITAFVGTVEQPTPATKPPTSGQQTMPTANQGGASATAQPAGNAKPPKACPDGSAPLADGTCAAPASAAPTTKSPASDAKPTKTCPDGSAPLADGKCATPAGAAPTTTKPASEGKPPKACPDGSAPLADGTCAAPASAAPTTKQPEGNAKPAKACPDGSALLADGTCAAPATAAPTTKKPESNAKPPKACPDGSAPLADGKCAPSGK